MALDENLDNGEFLGGMLWFERSASIVTIGLTSAGLETLGDLESIELYEAGDTISDGEEFGTIEGSYSSLELISPVTGEIFDVNAAVQKDPARVVEDPLDEGWLIKIEIKEALSEDDEDAEPDDDQDDDEEDDSDEDDEEEDLDRKTELDFDR